MAKTMKSPWRKDTNDRYLGLIKIIMNLSTASLFLPVLFTRELMGVDNNNSLIDLFDYKIYAAWVLLGTSIISSIFFMYFSAKWIRLAWDKKAGLLWCDNTKESTIEKLMELTFWISILTFIVGIFLMLFFFIEFIVCYH